MIIKISCYCVSLGKILNENSFWIKNFSNKRKIWYENNNFCFLVCCYFYFVYLFILLYFFLKNQIQNLNFLLFSLKKIGFSNMCSNVATYFILNFGTANDNDMIICLLCRYIIRICDKNFRLYFVKIHIFIFSFYLLLNIQNPFSTQLIHYLCISTLCFAAYVSKII